MQTLSCLKVCNRFSQIPAGEVENQFQYLLHQPLTLTYSTRSFKLTPSSVLTPSACAIISIRACELLCARGRNRNLLHREATGSMILQGQLGVPDWYGMMENA